MPAEVDRIYRAIKKKNPKMSDKEAWAIAYDTYRKKGIGKR